jgi:DNA repair exonuclease SbcCD ATPase subunit
MKKAQIFNIDIEHIEKLKELGNMSEFVNNLLSEYFEKGKEVLIEKYKQKVEEAKEIKEEVLEIEKTEQEKEALREIEIQGITDLREDYYKHIPSEIDLDFRTFDFTESSLYDRWKNQYDRQYRVSFETIKKTWKTYLKLKELNLLRTL